MESKINNYSINNANVSEYIVSWLSGSLIFQWDSNFASDRCWGGGIDIVLPNKDRLFERIDGILGISFIHFQETNKIGRLKHYSIKIPCQDRSVILFSDNSEAGRAAIVEKVQESRKVITIGNMDGDIDLVILAIIPDDGGKVKSFMFFRHELRGEMEEVKYIVRSSGFRYSFGEEFRKLITRVISTDPENW